MKQAATTTAETRRNNRRMLRRLLSDTRPIRGSLVLCACISLLSVVLVLVGPELLGALTDVLYAFWATGEPIDLPAFVAACGVLAGIYALSALCELVTMTVMNRVVSRHFTCRMRVRISEKICRLPVQFVDETPNGEVIARMTNDVSVLGNTVHNFLNIAISGVLKLLGITAILFFLQPVMAAAVVVLVPLSLLLSSRIAARSETHFAEYRKLTGELYALHEEDFTGFDTVKAFHLEPLQNGRQAALCGRARVRAEQGYYLSGVVQPVVALTNNAAYIAVCILGGYLAVRGALGVGDVVAFILYARLFAGPLESIAGGLSTMQHTFVATGRVYDLLDREEMESPAAPADVPAGAGHIRFSHVDFAYDAAHPLIRDLNIDVQPGQKVAIVGPTGGGKTTIVNLLMRFYDVDAGAIYLDGVDTRTMDRAALRARFSMVLQDTWLFSGTVFENIAYGKPGATREEVLEAARRAHIDYFIDTLPQGYDTPINEESTNISSGQKQLLTIARAYLANRSILILDEATSNVDTRTELLIQQTMDELMHGRTSFVIAHRLSTIVNADVILVVNNGRIVEQGTHETLLAQNGFYAEIYHSQYALLG